MSHRPFRLPALALLLVMAGVTVAANPAEITIYRCTDSSGRLTLRDTPCRKGETQQTREMQRPTDPPPRRQARTAPAPAEQPPEEPAPAEAPPNYVVVTPPRPMYECVTYEGETYLSDTAEGNPRWVELWALGYPVAVQRNPLGDNVGGPRPRPSGTGPGPPRLPVDVGLAMTPGSWIRDPCYALSPQEICEHLRDRHHELGRQYNSALQSDRARIDNEQQVIAQRLDNECGGR
jgi:hypothetical protein